MRRRLGTFETVGSVVVGGLLTWWVLGLGAVWATTKVACRGSVSTAAAPVAQLLPGLGELRAVHWAPQGDPGAAACQLLPAPDQWIEGVAQLVSSVDLADRFTWTAAEPVVAPALAGFVLASPIWRSSVDFDRAAARPGTTARLHVDLAAGVVYFHVFR